MKFAPRSYWLTPPFYFCWNQKQEQNGKRVSNAMLLRCCECMLIDPPPNVALFCLLELGDVAEGLRACEEEDRLDWLLERVVEHNSPRPLTHTTNANAPAFVYDSDIS